MIRLNMQLSHSSPNTRSSNSVSRATPALCPRDIDRSILTRTNLTALKNASTSKVLQMDVSDDLDHLEVDQMKALQKSLDHFTDYEHYERCCNSRHSGLHCKDECHDGAIIDPLSTNDQCAAYCDDCDECADEHKDCYDEVEVCDDDCEQCEVECEQRGHEPEDCPHDHPTTRDNCTPPGELNSVPLPQLGPTNDFDAHAMSSIVYGIIPCTEECSVLVTPPVQATRHNHNTMAFDYEMDHWQTFSQAHHCAPDPCTIGQPPQFQQPQHIHPSFGFTFGCDPTLPANQYPWQRQTSPCNVLPIQQMSFSNPNMTQPPYNTKSVITPPSIPSQFSDTCSSPTVSSNLQSKPCEWVMPCGSICGAAFDRTEDLKKHIKNSHCTKGTVSCRWQSCTASFATEAALTGHISKKHLTVSDEEGPWKCTFPGCTKSFMYKQVRDDHLASHNGGNRMHCPICHQWLNCEGSNFRRHMASHGPKTEHMRCRFESLGCKKRFPRLDNLRRHEACCKFGKRAAGVHHHHHTVHIGHTP